MITRVNSRIDPSYHSCDFPSKMTITAKNEIFEVSRNSAYSSKFTFFS